LFYYSPVDPQRIFCQIDDKNLMQLTSAALLIEASSASNVGDLRTDPIFPVLR